MTTFDFDAPIAVRSVAIDQPLADLALPASEGGATYNGVYALATRDGRPVGTFAVAADGGVVTAPAIATAIDQMEAGERATGLPTANPTGERKPLDDDTPLVTVVVCTVNGGASASRTIDAVLAGTHQNVEVVLVNNRPVTTSVNELLDQRYASEPRVGTVDEDRPGLSYARNAGLAAATGSLIAFTDDDVVPDVCWLERAVLAFIERPAAACVTGLIVPLKLETSAQVLLERFAGYSKGFQRQVFSLCDFEDDPLFPYAAGRFGSGANIVLRRSAAEALGGFDNVLGTGTPARGGEDLDLFIRVLISGLELVYEPSAMIWHEHPDTIEHIEREVQHYGSGLSAAIVKQLVCGPRRRRLLRGFAAGVRYGLSPGSPKNARKGDRYPLRLTIAELIGVAYGPIGYARSRWRDARFTALRKGKRGLLIGVLVSAGLFSGDATEAARASASSGTGARAVMGSASPAGEPPHVDFEPIWVQGVEISEPISRLIADQRADGLAYGSARVLVRLHSIPLGFAVVELTDGSAEPTVVADAIDAQLGDEIAEHLRRDSLPPAPLTAAGLTATAEPLAGKSPVPTCGAAGEFADQAPFATVVICSCNRPDSLARALHSVLALDYPDFEIVVVDNLPREPGTREAVEALGSPRIAYVAEPLPGLSRARNRGFSVARGDLIAFTDDDVVVDAQWLAALARAFTHDKQVGMVTGLVPTAELRTEAQQFFDQTVTWSAWMDRRVFDRNGGRGDGPFYPYRAGRFGTGANFAISREAARQIGPFDEALGAGSPAGGGEDLDYFLRVIDHGWRIAVEPAAITWHYHRVTADALEKQLYTYGTGAMAYGFKHALVPRHAARLGVLVTRELMRGLKHGRTPAGPNRGKPYDPVLTRIERKGRLAGPWLYVKGRFLSRSWPPLKIT
ncbi:MAG: glycosyltransferase [Solirubrobacterales bacterium]